MSIGNFHEVCVFQFTNIDQMLSFSLSYQNLSHNYPYRYEKSFAVSQTLIQNNGFLET